MTPQQSQFADRCYVTNANAFSKINDDRGLSTSEKNLFWMTHYDRFAIHSKFKGQERLRVEGCFQAGQFHIWEFSFGNYQGKP